MGQVIDFNKMAASIYEMMMKLQQSATKLIGLDALWCRAIPQENSEDIIVQEYTLSNVDCPKQIRVVLDKTDYQPGNYNVELWGVNYENPLDVSIDIKTWEALYGKNTMPQKGDIAFIQMLHRPYEVASATVIYGVGEMPTSFKCTLRKYQRTASRRESEEFQIQIDTLSNDQERMFGDDISKEVADSVMAAEKHGNISTYVDPLKDCDLTSIITEHITGTKGNIVSDAHYSFKNADRNITYSIKDSVDVMKKHIIFSAWFRIKENTVNTYKLQIGGIYLKEKEYWYFTVENEKDLVHIPDTTQVYIKRGNTLLIPGEVFIHNDVDKNGECVSKFTIKVKVSDIMVASQRIPNWWNSKGIWKLTTQNNYDIIRGMNGDDTVYRVNLDPASLKCTINEYTLSAPLGRQHDFGNWTYMAIDVHKDDAFMIISQLDYALNGHIKDNILYSGKVSKNIINYNMEFDKFVIPLKGTDIDMSNIRIYESEYSMENEWQMDMYSRVVQNASKLILVDTPLNANDMSFISPLR